MWGGDDHAPTSCAASPTSVDKYKIPTVKVTGGQRIDLLGVKKEDLPDVWKDLGMPSGHAYAKALRTVKTCVGSEWCRFGTQDSHADGQRPRARAVAHVRAAQGEARGVAAARATAPSPASRTSA